MPLEFVKRRYKGDVYLVGVKVPSGRVIKIGMGLEKDIEEEERLARLFAESERMAEKLRWIETAELVINGVPADPRLENGWLREVVKQALAPIRHLYPRDER